MIMYAVHLFIMYWCYYLSNYSLVHNTFNVLYWKLYARGLRCQTNSMDTIYNSETVIFTFHVYIKILYSTTRFIEIYYKKCLHSVENSLSFEIKHFCRPFSSSMVSTLSKSGSKTRPGENNRGRWSYGHPIHSHFWLGCQTTRDLNSLDHFSCA